MNLFKNIFSKTEAPILGNEDFWNWFVKNETKFFNAVKKESNMVKDFFEKISPKLDELKDGFYFLTGMCDEDTVELILTSNGVVKNFVFVEELVNSAPKIKGWKFTALKQPHEIEEFKIKMYGYEFNTENIHFFVNENPNQPDEIDLTVVYDGLSDDNSSEIAEGVFIFLDNYLGEMNLATLIDSTNVIVKGKAKKDLIPINKIKSFLIWREKEFIEKYEGTRHHTASDSYSNFEAQLTNGRPLLIMVNTDLLKWDAKASHPWSLKFGIKYDGGDDGLPDIETYQLLDTLEMELMAELSDYDGYLNVSRETGDGFREIYFTCKEFRKPAKVAYDIQKKYASRLDIRYEIYKDRYWKAFDRYDIQH